MRHHDARFDPRRLTFDLKSGLLWNTYAGDLNWFRHSARSYKKYARGWDFAKCIVPRSAVADFHPICEENGIFLDCFDEWPGKGFNHHQAMQCCGDLHFPDAGVIFHVDADCMFASECSPSDWLPEGKVLLNFMDFKHYLNQPVTPEEEKTFMGFTGRRMDFDRGQYLWKFAADFALGFPVERETMQEMPIVHIREVYAKTREVISARFGKSFEDYVQSCRNEWPQSFCEFNTLGGIAHKFFQDRYHWRNIHADGHAFAGKVVQCWSHGGFDRPHNFAMEVGGHQTPRELFARLGIE